jgi:glutathione S-transferase
MLTFYDNDFSTCAQKVRLVLHEKGAEWRTIWLDLRAGDQLKPDYLRLNPNGVVPTVVDDDMIVIESSIIIQYLDEKFGQLPVFTPTHIAARARARQWMQWIDTKLHADIAVLSIGIAFRHELIEKTKTVEALEAHMAQIPIPTLREIWRGAVRNGLNDTRFKSAVQEWDRALSAMEGALADHEWVCGETYSFADVSLLPYILRLDHLGLLNVLCSERPHVWEWYRRLRSRPASIAALDRTIPEEKTAFVRECAKREEDSIAQTIESLRREQSAAV